MSFIDSALFSYIIFHLFHTLPHFLLYRTFLFPSILVCITSRWFGCIFLSLILDSCSSHFFASFCLSVCLSVPLYISACMTVCISLWLCFWRFLCQCNSVLVSSRFSLLFSFSFSSLPNSYPLISFFQFSLHILYILFTFHFFFPPVLIYSLPHYAEGLQSFTYLGRVAHYNARSD